jgi:hypothetical protein
MTTTAFQYIFDTAAAISINKRSIVAQTTSRDQTVRTVSRGGNIWRFDVTPPAGLPWSDARPYIEAIDAADRFTVGLVQINQTGYNSWFTAYQGNSVNSTGFVASANVGDNFLTLTTSPTTASGYKFRTRDIVQFGSGGHVYSVAADVAYNSNRVTLNRAIMEDTASLRPLFVGPNVTWSVICIGIPNWTISQRNIVTFDNTYKFVEYIS